MSTTQLPKFIEPLKFCQKVGRGGQSTLSGQLDIGHNLAIGDMLEGPDKPNQSLVVQADLHFGQDETGFNLVTGRVCAKVKLRCQRCLVLFDYPLDINLNLSPILSEKELDSLPDYVEPLLLQDDGLLSVVNWLTEELHLALPMVPKHKSKKKCQLTLPKDVTLLE